MSHVSCKIDAHKCRIWGSENSLASLEHVCDSPKVNVFCALSEERVYSPFFFMETTTTGIVYLGMLEQILNPQLDEDDQERRIHLQQVGAPPHYLAEMREYRNSRFRGRWIGRAAPVAWPPRSPDLTTPNFSYRDLLKTKCSYHLCLQMSVSSELELLPQLQE
jgi:hypothetical protein